MAWGSHVGLLVTAFLAATLLPGSSEALLATLVVQLPSSKLSLLLVATVGNTAGACVNWYLGRAAMTFGGRRWFPATLKHIERASGYLNRFGSWPLLFSWLPIVGDPLTVAAGVLRIRFIPFLTLVATGKFARYVFIVAGVEWTLSLAWAG
jgi:membrane protein YqaA with SNARE-associated domain